MHPVVLDPGMYLPVRRPADWRMFQKRNGTFCIPVEEHRPKVSGSPRVPARHLGPLRSLDTISRTHCCIRMDGCVPVSPSGLFDRRCNSSIDQLPRSRHDSRRRTVPCDGVVHAVQCHPAATMSPAFLSAASDATATPSQRFHVGPALALAPGPCHPHLTKAPQIAHAMYTRRTYLQVHHSLVWPRPLRCSAVSSHPVVVACSVLWSRETTSVLAGMQTGAPCLGPGGPWGRGRKPNNRPASFGWRSHRGTLASEVEPLKPRQFRTLLFQPLLPLQPAGM